MKKLLLNENRDIKLGWLLLAGLLLLVLKLWLAGAQKMYLEPEAAALDDMFMYNTAVSIAKGEWLGAYNWLTLSKHTFFALWLALLHWLGIPYLMGGQALWALASLAGAAALAPALKKRWLTLGLFALLLFLPSSTANPAPYAYTARVYRDNIFPALCLLCIAGVVGVALRYAKGPKHTLGWAALAGVALAACRLTREDGLWLLPFVAVGLAAAGFFIVRSGSGGKLKQCAVLLLPFVLLLGGELAWRGMNYSYYGRFIISDFSSGEFADAYGAMTRIEHKSWDPKVAVPYDVRQKLYQHVPAFAPLEPILESPGYHSQYGELDYSSGAFYWALRQAAAELGHYDSPQASQAYFASLAQDINALCDEGVLPATGRRSSVNPPIKAAYVAPVLQETAANLGYCATFQGCDPRSLFSPRTNDPTMYQQKVLPMEEFLHDEAQTISMENSTEAYLLPWEARRFTLLDMIRAVYTVALPLALAGALVWQVWGAASLIGRLRRKQKNSAASLLWLIGLGLLCCILLRAAMIAFVTVSSFTIGRYIMYLASIHPLMLIYGFWGTWGLLCRIIALRQAGRPQKENA